MKICKDCGENKPLSEYYSQEKIRKKTSETYIYYQPYCKECATKRAKKWQDDNYEQYQEGFLKRMRAALKKPEKKEYNRQLARKQKESGYYKEYQQKNKEYFNEYSRNRRMNKTHTITNEQWLKCKAYFNNSCAYCGLHIDDHYIIFGGELRHTDLHKEHVDHNGSNGIDNCVPACAKCNSNKWTFELADWYTPDNEMYNVERLLKIIKWIEEDYLIGDEACT